MNNQIGDSTIRQESESNMTWAFTQTYPNVSLEQYHEIGSMLAGQLPDEMLAHYAGAAAENIQIIEVWESRQAFDDWHRAVLAPLVLKTIGRDAVAAGTVTALELDNAWATPIGDIAETH